MNFMCAFLLEEGIEEEEVFWIMVYLINEVIPRNYFTNMVPLMSDIKLVKYFIKEKFPKYLTLIQRNQIDLNMVLLPWFLVIFTQIENRHLKIIIMSKLMAEGIIVYFKMILILFGLSYKKLNSIKDQLDFKRGMESELENPDNFPIFQQKLKTLYINSELIDQIRKTMLRKEYYKYIRDSQTHPPCQIEYPFCQETNVSIIDKETFF